MTRDTPEPLTWEVRENLTYLELCLTCFRLRGVFEGKEHRCSCQRRPDSWREREWTGYDIAALVDLCNLCARGTMKSGSRYTWLVCQNCLQVNRMVGGVLGSHKAGALPVGRHSLMNGVALRGGDQIDESVKAFSGWLFGLTRIWLRVFDWGPAEAQRLADLSAFEGSAVPLLEWLDRFPASVGASTDAFCRFVEYDLPQHPQLQGLIAARTSFVASKDTG